MGPREGFAGHPHRIAAVPNDGVRSSQSFRRVPDALVADGRMSRSSPVDQVVRAERTSSARDAMSTGPYVSTSRWGPTRRGDFRTQEFRVRAAVVQMARIPVAPAIALLRQRDVETTADLHEGSRQATHQGQGVRIQVLSMRAAVRSSAARSVASTAALPSSRDSSTVAGVPEWSMRASLNSSFARRSMPSSSASAWDSVVLPEPGHPPTSTKPSTHSTLPVRRAHDIRTCRGPRARTRIPASSSSAVTSTSSATAERRSLPARTTPRVVCPRTRYSAASGTRLDHRRLRVTPSRHGCLGASGSAAAAACR